MHSVPQEGKGRKGATDVGKGWGAGIVIRDLVSTLSTTFIRLASLGGGPQAHVHMEGKKCRGEPFFSGEENWCLLRIRSRSGLRFTKTEHSCLVDLNITPCISCLPYAREPEACPLGWLAL